MILCYHAVNPVWRDYLSVHPRDFVRHAAWLSRRKVGTVTADQPTDSGRLIESAGKVSCMVQISFPVPETPAGIAGHVSDRLDGRHAAKGRIMNCPLNDRQKAG